MQETDSDEHEQIERLRSAVEQRTGNAVDSQMKGVSLPIKDELILRMGVISNLLDTLKTSLDQIFICFEMSRMMFFYGDLLREQPDSLLCDQDANFWICSNHFAMASRDIEFLNVKIGAEISRWTDCRDGGDANNLEDILTVLRKNARRHHGLVWLFREATRTLEELGMRSSEGELLYDQNQKPDLGGCGVRETLKELYMRSSQKIATAITDNIQSGKSILAIPFSPEDQEYLEELLPRFQVLQQEHVGLQRSFCS